MDATQMDSTIMELFKIYLSIHGSENALNYPSFYDIILENLEKPVVKKKVKEFTKLAKIKKNDYLELFKVLLSK